ncbi:MAG TPA: M56 family metallopeptidase, partial [Chitinophagaceae bacterium]|nr:M56 family metallopeptidase [Chitinophagaceae bacterium]
MTLLGQSAFLKALGWALLNSLWQFSLLWLVFLVLIRQRKTLSPAIKHGFAITFLVAGFLWFGVGLSVEYFEYKSDPVTEHTGIQITTSALFSSLYRSATQVIESNLAYLSVIYLVIVGGLFTRFSRYFYNAHAIQTRGISKLPVDLRLYVQQLRQQLNIHREVRVWISELIDTPMVIGFLKPTILIPVASINHLSVTQLEAILLHELAHIRRNDYLLNLYMATMEVLFFFNPFSRLLLQSIKEEREKCCDDWVLQFNYDPHQYATALLRLEQNRPTMHHVAMAATGESNRLLLHRVQRIMGVPRPESHLGFKLLAYCLSFALLVFIALVNPGDLVIPKLPGGSMGATIVKSAPVGLENSPEIRRTTLLKPPAILRKASVETAKAGKKPRKHPEIVRSETAFHPDETEVALLAALHEHESEEFSPIVEAVHAETRDFTTPVMEKPEIPLSPSEYVMPFVPYSSFSYQDTT